MEKELLDILLECVTVLRLEPELKSEAAECKLMIEEIRLSNAEKN